MRASAAGIEPVAGEAVDGLGRHADDVARAQQLRRRGRFPRGATALLACAARPVSCLMDGPGMEQFESFKASQLYCRKCAKSMPVRERLLLMLPDKELYEYLCTGCAESLGRARGFAGGKAARVPARSAPRSARGATVKIPCAFFSSAPARSACPRCARWCKSPDHSVLGVVTQPDKPVGRQLKLARQPGEGGGVPAAPEDLSSRRKSARPPRSRS